ncbi:hypothetical protein FKP32DRAFT_1645019 [Trametes sanguinea]|nr:hypothetical protein FKP32DRAFT_1645019 [Trametes sanguinea]
MSQHPPSPSFIPVPLTKRTVEVPPFLLPGHTIAFKPSGGGRALNLTIIKPFVPFTKSAALLVRSEQWGCNRPMVIKIFDPRFLDERLHMGCKKWRPPEWTLAAEAAANHHPDIQENDVRIYKPLDHLEGEELLARLAFWEKYFRELSYECFDSEWQAYERLRDYQGSVIPRMFMRGSVIHPDERAIHPPAVIIEYIPDPLPLRDVTPGAVDVDICIPLIRAVDTFGSHGLFHGDVNLNNVLFSPRTPRPTRAVLIDFGCAGFRFDNQNDEDWEVQVQVHADSLWIRKHLREQGVPIPEDI